MELRHFRYFVAAAEEEHVGLAARRLNVSQPSLSRAIADLEQELGVRLFERAGRGIRLNPAGRQFLAGAQQVLAEVERASASARRVGSGEVGQLDIGAVDTVSWAGVVPEALRALRSARPGVLLRLFPLSSRDQLAAIQGGRLDVGFLYNRPREDPATQAIAVAEDKVVLAVPADHGLSGAGKVALSDLAEEAFVSFPRAASPVYHDRLARACAGRGLQPRVVQEAATGAGILAIVASGLGIAFVNSAVRWRRPHNIELLEVDDLELKLVLDCVWRDDNEAPALAPFLEAVRGLVAAAR